MYKKREGIDGLAEAGGEIEEIAITYWKEERERAMAGTGGKLCTTGWVSEHGRKRRRCPKREQIKEKGSTHHQQGFYALLGTRHVRPSARVLRSIRDQARSNHIAMLVGLPGEHTFRRDDIQVLSDCYISPNVPALASPRYSLSIACLQTAEYPSAHASAYEFGVDSSLTGRVGRG